MNKYSKRALKTTATVGMSLAMVLSGVAAPLTNVNAAETICSSDQTTNQILLTKFLSDVIKIEDVKTADSTKKVTVNAVVIAPFANAALFTEYYKLPAATTVVSDTTTPGADEITLSEAKALPLTIGTNIVLQDTTAAISGTNQIAVGDVISYKTTAAVAAGAELTVKGKVNLFDYLAGTATVTEDGMGTNAVAFRTALTALKTDCVGDAYDQAKYLVDMSSNVTALNTLVSAYSTTYSTLSELTTATQVATAEAALDNLDLYKDYQGNLTANEKSAHDDVKANIENLVAAFYGENTNNSTMVAAYVTKYEAPLNKFIEGKALPTLDSKAEFIAAMASLKKEADYKYVKEDATVIAILEGMQAVVDNFNAVEALAMPSKNEALKTFRDRKALSDEYTQSVSQFMSGNTANAIVSTMTVEQYDIYKEYADSTIGQLATYTTRQIGSIYSTSSKLDGELGLYTNATGLTTFENSIKSGFFTTQYKGDNKNATTYAEELDIRMTEVKAALKAVTTDIEGITAKNVKASDRKVLTAADAALTTLMDTTQEGYSSNLNKAEKASLRTIERTIDSLFDALSTKGDTNLVGWYDMGNGDYGFNNEDGTPAAYKWIASGSNWYFVRDGKMARNTWLAANSTDWYYLGSDGKMATSVTVDGCWINSLGIYKK